jgi:DNA repair protein RadC
VVYSFSKNGAGKTLQPIAKFLIHSFGNIAGIINATHEKLQSTKELTKSTITNILLLKEILDRIFYPAYLR